MANKYTWRELKEFCNKLSDEHLDKEIIWLGEEDGGKISSAYQLDEDYIDTDYGFCEPLSAQPPINDDDDPYEVAYLKGTPILTTN